jgi:hypothetical protein
MNDDEQGVCSTEHARCDAWTLMIRFVEEFEAYVKDDNFKHKDFWQGEYYSYSWKGKNDR